MATTPSEPPQRTSYPYSSGATLDFARMPIPGNAEFVVYAIAVIVFALIAIFDDQVSSAQFLSAATLITAAYLLSRGIAKASRVLEQ